ncbi:hypothetical protein Sp245p_25835 (plasmid) [Azospirillum baldaniorum]|uniref:Uncharacterized protein n=1 Tax=Azospirillum baldaniorum TaxID=1064539 RepID=A0A9P1NRF2_9PROT|nr:hypothetical protein Sp245p_25835 [Azospirillum baldaniorum]CCD02960.1 protein of unknown function [Azospirillum baldaniorum]
MVKETLGTLPSGTGRMIIAAGIAQTATPTVQCGTGSSWPLAKRSAGSVPTAQPDYNKRRIGTFCKA